MIRVALAFLLLALTPAVAVAHEVRPAYLEIREVEQGVYDVLWKVPARDGDRRLGIYTRFPDDARPVGEPRAVAVGGAYIERSRLRLPSGLGGRRIHIDGLSATGTDVLVRVVPREGDPWTTLVRPALPSFLVEPVAGPAAVAGAYFVLGVEHILLGIDHLLFLLALLLIVGLRWGLLLKTITAFTLAHSVTLALAALGIVHVPPAPVEAVIALSIVFVACEIVHGLRGRRGLTSRAPWLVALSFGLLHGFGFAGALSEIGLPPSHIPTALLTFNLGVEAGQLLFVAAVVAGIALTARLRSTLPVWTRLVPPYAIGVCAAFWMIQRLAAF